MLGVVKWELHLEGCHSLKDKRRIVKSLKDRLHRTLNVSVAETGHLDLWQRAELACCVVSNERRHAQSVLSSANELVAREHDARVIDSTTNFL